MNAVADQEEADEARTTVIRVDRNIPEAVLDEEDDIVVDGVELEEDVDDDNVDEVIDVLALPPELALLRRSKRIRIGFAAPDRLTLVTKIKESEWNKQEETSKAVKSELKQLFH